MNVTEPAENCWKSEDKNSTLASLLEIFFIAVPRTDNLTNKFHQDRK
jgi:hypothetical protein